MSHLQAVLEFCIELHKFVNIDLFQRGFYQIRLTHKLPSKVIHKIEVNYNKLSKDSSLGHNKEPGSKDSSSSSSANGSIVFPACIVNGAAVSQTFQILYKNEELELNDVITFKSHIILDASRCIDQVKRINFSLLVELWFTEEDFGPQHHNSIQCVSSRTLRLNVDMCRGLHYHLPVFFDYFHLSAVTMSVHASLTTLCQPYLKNQRVRPKTAGASQDPEYMSTDPSGYDYLLFGCSLTNLKDLEWNEIQTRMRRAQLVHWQLCSIIFTSMQAMERKLTEYRHLIAEHRKRSRSSSSHGKRSVHLENHSSNDRSSRSSRHHSHDQHLSNFGLTDIKPNQRSMSSLAQSCYKSTIEENKDRTKDFIAHQNKSLTQSSSSSSQFRPGDYITLVESDLAYLSGLSILLWEQLMKTILHSDIIANYLSQVHHSRRVKRFSEGFFLVERDRRSLLSSICDSSHTSIFNEVSENLRKSRYFYLLPPCDVECLALDGDVNTLPIIYQDVYGPTSQCDLSHNKRKSSSESSKSRTKSSHSSSSCLSPSPILLNSPSPSPKSPRNTVRFSFDVQNIDTTESSSINPSRPKLRKLRSRSKSPTPTYDATSLGIPQRRRQSSPRGTRLVASVTVSDLKEFSVKQSSKQSTNQPTEGKKTSASTKNMSSSQSVPDLTSCCQSSSTKPKRRAKSTIEHNKEKRYRSRLHPSSAETFEGTAYFPKPPPEFSSADAIPSRVSGHKKPPHSSRSKESSMNNLSTELNQLSISFKTPGRHSGKKDTNSTSSELSVDTTWTRLTGTDDDLSIDSCIVCEVGRKCSCNTASLLAIEREQGINQHHVLSPSSPRTSSSSISDVMSVSPRRTISSRLISFLEAKEEFRREKGKGWIVYSDFNSLPSMVPYFQVPEYVSCHRSSSSPLHLVICVHGLDGNSGDLRLVKTYLELGLPHVNFDFLMSQRNQGETFDCFETMTDRLVKEITYYIEVYRLDPQKISFIGHSLGNIIIRAALSHPDMKPWLPRLYTFLSLSGPHLGTSYNPSGLVNMGLWVFQKWKKSASLLQLAMKDNVDVRQCYLYKLSQDRGLEYFQFVLLCGSSQDNYVPIHSAHIELCTAALNDTSSTGTAYREMVSNLLDPLVKKESCQVCRFDVHHALSSSSANSIIGRAAHIAVLDSELFIEKFMVVCGLQYFA